MPAVERLLELTSRFLGIVAGVLVLAMMGQICLDVFARMALGRSLHGTIEIVSAYYMVAVIFLPLMQVTRLRDHIAADLVTRRLPANVQFVTHMIVSAIGLAFMCWFSYQSFLSALDRTRRGEAWESGAATITVWPSRWVLAIGIAFMTLQMAAHFATDLYRFPRNSRVTRGHEEAGNGQ